MKKRDGKIVESYAKDLYEQMRKSNSEFFVLIKPWEEMPHPAKDFWLDISDKSLTLLEEKHGVKKFNGRNSDV